MSTISIRSHVSFDTDEDTNTHIGSSSSPIQPMNDALVASSSSPIRNDILPLKPSRTIPALNKRGVIFSPRTDTKYFHSDDLILTSPKINQLTPKSNQNQHHLSSIRSYSDPVTPFETPSHSSFHKTNGTPNRILSDTPTLVRSILKSRMAQQIRLASTVEEGTLNNKEAARLLVSGKRPKLLARDSFQLALMRNAAQDGVEAGDRKGKSRMQDQIPSSDDSNCSDPPGIPIPPNQLSSKDNDNMLIDGDSSEEEEETIEEDGALSTASLVSIILDGAEDLLTLEEAYNTLTLRLRSRIPTEDDHNETPSIAELDDIRISTQPIKDEAPAMVRAIQRDLQRLLGKLPHSEIGTSESDITPFRGLMPLRDIETPTSKIYARFTPSPTPGIGPKSSSPTKAARQGYTESEVRYRREASGVGAAVLRFLAFVFHSPHLFICFSEADLQALLEQVMAIPRTPKLPTPNPKRTYYLSIVILAQMNLPSACVQPVKDKIVRALEGAMADTLGAMGGAISGKEGPSAVRKEGFHAVTNLVSNYPTILFPYYPDLLSTCLKGLANPNNLIRYKAGSAVAAFARARFTLLANTQIALLEDPNNPTNKENWIKTKTLISKSEFFVISHLKSALKLPGKSAPIYGKDGEKKMEWHTLEQIFKDTVGSMTDVHWACAAWSLLVTLMGSAYASSGLASGFDHIMDRSLQPSTNTSRPLLARVAWNHAIHAYLSSGFASSISEDGQLIRSYKPFAASSQQTVEQRTANIQFPVTLALSKATDKASYARALTNAKPGSKSHYIWQRSEKSKKLQWLITCGLGATAVIHAHTGMALCHEDQPAKEMSQISGLPSSDGGMVIPDLSPEEAKLPQLDHAWEKVVSPMLRSFFAICGVDRLTIHGWKMLEAITSPAGTDSQPGWNLDKLLTTRYMSGEIFTREKEFDIMDLLTDIQDDELQPSDIPSWGQFWLAKRLGRLIILFDEALSSIHGINDAASIDWIVTHNGTPVIPTSLSNIWKNLLLALKSAKLANSPPTPLFLVGLQTITRQMIQVFNRDPKSYVPITKIDEKGQCLSNEDDLRIGLTAHLFDVALEVLGEDVLGSIRLQTDQLPLTSTSTTEQFTDSIFQSAFGSDANGHPTVAGTLLGCLLRAKVSTTVQMQFTDLFSKVLDIGTAPGYAGKLLGDITNAMPFLFEDSESMQNETWRKVSLKWIQIIDLQPTSSNNTSSTNHTGALLVSLLSGPFRGGRITSYWHQSTTRIDLAIWRELLKITILRFKAKRFGSNCGVLETLAGHLGDFLDGNDKTKSTTMTLSCLASAIPYLSFTAPSPSSDGSQNTNKVQESSPWDISNDNFVPNDFLTLINDALIEAYPTREPEIESGSMESTQTELKISPALFELLENTVKVLENTPMQFVCKVMKPVRSGLAIWLEDKEKVVGEDENVKLDQLYIALLDILSASMPSDDLPINSETLNGLAELYIPRISKATSSAVPLAFQSFWNKTFATATPGDLQYSEDVADFLRDLLVAVPNMITCPGLKGESQLTEEESLSRYPHIQSARIAPEPEQEQEQPEPISVEIEMQMTNPEYDADISQSIEPTQIEPQPHSQPPEESEILVDATKDDIQLPSSPVKVSDEVVVSENTGSEDVFGPAAMTKTSKSKKRKTGGKKSKTKSKNSKTTSPDAGLGEERMELQSLPEVERTKIDQPTNSHSLPDVITPLVEDSENEDCIVVVPSPGYYKRRGLRQTETSDNTPQEDEDAVVEQEEQVQDVVVDTPTMADDTTTVAEEVEEEEPVQEVVVEEEEEGVETPQQEVQPIPTIISPTKPSLLSSASRWLSRVQSFPFFSPPATSTPVPFSIAQQEPPVEEVKSPIVESPREEEVVEPEPELIRVPTNKKGKKSKSSKNRRSSNSLSSIETASQDKQDVVATAELPKSKRALNKSQSMESILSNSSNTSTVTRSKGKRKAAEIDSEPQEETMEEQESSEPRRSNRKRPKSISEDFVVEHPQRPRPLPSPISEKPVVIETSHQPIKPRRRDVAVIGPNEPEAPIELDDDEDELLLSPESARRRKREEEAEVNRVSQSKSNSNGLSANQQQWSESISGRFDDAPGDSSIALSLPRRPIFERTPSSPSPKNKAKSSTERRKSRSRSKSSNSETPSVPSSPIKSNGSVSGLGSGSNLPTTSPNKRTNQQSKLIKMLDDAVRSKNVIDNLDYQGVRSLLKNLNTLREAAEGRMISRMEELRNERR